MKNKNLIYIIAMLLNVAPACKSDKPIIVPGVDGFVRDIGTKKALGGLSISVIGTDGRSEYTAATTNTDATGYFKTDFETQNGYSYQLRCKDSAHSNPTWFWVDVNQKKNPYNVRNSGEDLTKEKTQHQDMWMGRFAEYDSIEFISSTPFLKSDSIVAQFYDRYLFKQAFHFFIFKDFTKDSTSIFYFRNFDNRFLGDSYTIVKLSGLQQGKQMNILDSIFIPSTQAIVPKIYIP